MKVIVKFGRLSREVGRFRNRDVGVKRQRLVRRVARRALEETIRLNPVETGRSRSAWVEGLRRLGGVPPAGWQGSRSEPGSVEEGRERAMFEESGTRQKSEIRVGSRVKYIHYLEYGTSRMPAFAMVRRALQLVRRFFRG